MDKLRMPTPSLPQKCQLGWVGLVTASAFAASLLSGGIVRAESPDTAPAQLKATLTQLDTIANRRMCLERFSSMGKTSEVRMD
jgi:hypothetical protein